jgi:hypothetical protein
MPASRVEARAPTSSTSSQRTATWNRLATARGAANLQNVRASDLGDGSTGSSSVAVSGWRVAARRSALRIWRTYQ